MESFSEEGKRRSRHIKGLDFNDVPLITEDELKAWERSYIKRIAERLSLFAWEKSHKG